MESLDVIGRLSNFFGTPERGKQGVVSSGPDGPALGYHLPDVYKGQNTHLKEQMCNLIQQHQDQFITKFCLPWTHIPGLEIEWDEINFNVRLMDRVPYEGVSRMQTSLKRSFKERVERRGIGMMLEHDFYMTPQGRKHFEQNMLAIRMCVQETANFDGLFALVTGCNYQMANAMRYGLAVRPLIYPFIKQEITNFALVHKDDRGIDRAIESVKIEMARSHAYPDTMIISPETALFVTMAPDKRIDHYTAGDAGPAQFAAGPQGFEGSVVRGLRTYAVHPFETHVPNQPSLNPLSRVSATGTFYYHNEAFPGTEVVRRREAASKKAFAEFIMQDGAMPGQANEARETAAREASANVQPIAGEQMFSVDLDYMSIYDVSDDSYKGLKYKDLWRASVLAHAGLGGEGEKLEEWLGVDPAGLNSAENAFDAGVRFLVIRPFTLHQTLSALVMKGGEETGRTLFGPSDFQLSYNTSTKTIEGHFTMHAKSVVTNPNNVALLRDIQMLDYLGGGNTSFYGVEGTGTFDIDKAAQDKEEMMTAVTSGSFNDTRSKLKSLMVIPYIGDLDFREYELFMLNDLGVPHEVSTGRAGEPEAAKWWPAPGNDAEKQLAGYKAFSAIYKFDQFGFGADADAVKANDFLSRGHTMNSRVLKGPVTSFPGHLPKYSRYHPGVGHLGGTEMMGDKRWRSGELITADNARRSYNDMLMATEQVKQACSIKA